MGRRIGEFGECTHKYWNILYVSPMSGRVLDYSSNSQKVRRMQLNSPCISVNVVGCFRSYMVGEHHNRFHVARIRGVLLFSAALA